ncbi:MAG: alpha/beta hydrolase [Treponema sp.]|nr:alpha/beta hydrolase [Treponema sp.]
MSIIIFPAALILALLAGLLIIALPNHFYRITVDRKGPNPRETNWLDTRIVEELWTESGDGLKLHALYVPAVGTTTGTAAQTTTGTAANGTADTAILVHGYSGDARQLASMARVFHDQFGMNVLLPDARGHGQSEGHYIGFGWPERLDMLVWMDQVRQRNPGTGIILFGVSMGASTVLMTSGEQVPPELKLIIADCGYTSVVDELSWQMKLRYRFSFPPLIRVVSRMTKRRAGYTFEEASALEQVKKSHVPTLFIHGEADTFVPFEMCGQLYRACAAPKELYTVPGAEHGAAYSVDGEIYEQRLALFLEKYGFSKIS